MSAESLLALVGRRTLNFRDSIVSFYDLLVDTAYWAVVAPFRGASLRWREAFIRMVQYGIDSIPIVTVICLLVGVIMALQSAYQLDRYGATIYVTALVGVSMTRELGPLMTAIIVAGRTGSAIAAEIGTMKVDEEIDALTTMAVNPVRFLVVPKVLALLIMMPCLTIMADLTGILGGFLLGITVLSIHPMLYLEKTAEFLVMRDITTGLVKSGVFALIIAAVGSYMGFSTGGGAEGVGRNTTRAVVVSIFLVITADVIFTALFYVLG